MTRPMTPMTPRMSTAVWMVGFCRSNQASDLELPSPTLSFFTSAEPEEFFVTPGTPAVWCRSVLLFSDDYPFP